jgi:hypothetical protein
VTAALTSDSKLFCPPRLLIGAYYPVRDVVPSRLLPPGVVRHDFRWQRKDTGEQLRPFARFMGERRAPIKDELFISGAIPEAYFAGLDYKTEYAIGELVFVSQRTVEILTPFGTP